jgi:hypothetical protein
MNDLGVFGPGDAGTKAEAKRQAGGKAGADDGKANNRYSLAWPAFRRAL